MIDISDTAVKSLCTTLNVYGNEYADETMRMLTALRQALSDQETRNAAQQYREKESATALAHRNGELTAALERMCEEFRGHDLPYGSTAYATAMALLNNTAVFTPQRSQDELIAKLKAALQPFAEFALDTVVDDGWGNNTHRESISTWFGPSDFINALKALDQYAWDIPLDPCPFCDSTDLAVMRGGDAEYYVHCENCGSSATAVQWNKRTNRKG